MRTISAVQERGLVSARATRLRVFVDRGSSDWVNLSDLEDRDWIESVTYGGDIDSDCDTATVRLFLKQDDLNLAPLVSGSKLNATAVIARVGNPIYFEVKVVEEGDTWMEVFRGEIDAVEWGSGLEFRCRDQMGALIDRFIETQQKYPEDPDTTEDMEVIAQAILDDHIGGIDLYSVNGDSGTPFDPTDSPDWVINEYVQRKQSIAEAIQILAEQAAGQVRYRWNATDGAFRLTFWQPDRGVRAQGLVNIIGIPANDGTVTLNATTFTFKTTPTLDTHILRGATRNETAQNAVDTINAKIGSELTCFYNPLESASSIIVEWKTPGTAGNSIVFTESASNWNHDGETTLGGYVAGIDVGATVRTFSADDYYEISNLSIDRASIRNKVRIVYGRFQEDRTQVTVEDLDSQDLYGIRFMEIAEDANSQIDTADEAITMANAALDDLKDVRAQKSVTMPYFPWVEPGDYYTFTANGHHYDTDQDLAVVSWRHTLSRTECRTTLQCRGTPAGGVLRWLSKEAQRVRAETDFYSNDAPSNAAGIPGMGSIIIEFDDPRGMSPPVKDWSISKVYVSTTNGFTPSASNQEYVGRETRVVIDGLIPGTTYYAVVEHLDASGNTSAQTTQITTATERTGPYHETQEREGGPINPNPNFAVFTKDETENPPDAWTVNVGAWGTGEGEFYFETADLLSGNRALRWNTDSDLTSNPTKRIMSDWFPVEADTLYKITVTYGRDGGTIADELFGLGIGYQIDDEDKNASPSATFPFDVDLSLSSNSWLAEGFRQRSAWFITSATDRYMRLIVEVDPDVGSGTSFEQPNFFVDRIIVNRDLVRLAFNNTSSTDDRSAAASTFVRPYLNDGSFVVSTVDNANAFVAGHSSGGGADHSYTVPFDGFYEIIGIVSFLSLVDGKFCVCRLQKDGTTLMTGVPTQKIADVTTPRAIAIWRGQLSAGAVVRIAGLHTDTVSRSLDDSNCQLYVQQLPERKE